uniref:procollagen-lysine 5-dioxygenase n=1 Tax=Lepeophtheirus salmonis TaxID=72036 RepID=A0A0K2SV11_LEPSM
MMGHSLFMILIPCLLLNSILVSSSSGEKNSESDGGELLILTVASDNTDGLSRYLRSASVNGLEGKVLGLGEEWKGGDMNHPGGAYKINLLKDELAQYKDRKDLIVLFSDSYDVIFLQKKDLIVETFKKMKAKAVFGAESFCWPDPELADKYPSSEGYKFLNSGSFIGYADILYQIVSNEVVKDTDDDQRYYTKIYLNEDLRSKFGMVLDHAAKLFQNLNGNVADVELRFEEDGYPFLHNVEHNTQPLLVHGNGPSKIVLNGMGNYLPMAWNQVDQCTSCLEDLMELHIDVAPRVLIGVYIEGATPFLTEFFEKLTKLKYPKDKLSLHVYNGNKYHDVEVNEFVQNHKKEYENIEVIKSSDGIKIWAAKNKGLRATLDNGIDYYFNLDSDAHLDNPLTLKTLIKQNRPIIAPMLLRPYKAWSNFWGALSSEGFYARSSDYMNIVQNERKGVWNVPYISSAYLVNANVLKEYGEEISYIHKLLDPDMAFCSNAREAGIFMYVDNLEVFGHLINVDDFVHTNTEKYNEIWEIMNNPYDWELRYLHENYSKNFDEENPPFTTPCPDVYNFPIFSKRYAKEFIAVMEENGQWSDGSSNDKRLDSGYEAVPTRDIHMNQVNYEKEWLYLLKTYVMPLQQKVFIGYFNDPPRALMSFIVRYKPDEQPSLKPHHDSSTYTINIALNDEYEGGGCRFIRYDCSVVQNPIGWMTMHPGRLTHYHEGLETTKGTRYIMITFVDP